MNTAASADSTLDLVVARGRDVRPLLATVWGAQRDLAGEYPLLFDDRAAHASAPGTFVTLRVDGRPVATCGYLEREFVTPFGALKIALLGSVSTHPDQRGRGFAGHVLAGAQALAEAAGSVATLLWPMDVEVYSRNGYTPAAVEWNIVLPTDLALGKQLDTRAARPSDASTLLELYQTHPTRVARSLSDFTRMLACPGMDARVAIERGAVVAYACRGRGGDLATCVHEWGGATEAVLGLISGFATEDRRSPRYVLAPDWASPVTEALLDAGCAAVTRPLGLARLANREAACRWLATRTNLAFRATSNGAEVDAPSGRVHLTDAQLQTAIFAPPHQANLLVAIATLLGREPENLPAYAFCWGLDSI